MSALMLVTNPIKRKGKKMATRKRRSSAQVAATRKLVALNKARSRVGKSVKRRVKRASASVAKTVRRTRRAAVGHVRRARRSHAGLARQGFGIVNLLKQAGVGAIGSTAVDIIYAKLPLPDSLKAGNTAPIVKAGITIGLGLLAGKVLSKQLAHGATVGALTVQLNSVLKGFLPASLQGYTDINGVEFYNPAGVVGEADNMGFYLNGSEPDNIGEYVGEYQEAVY